MTYDEVVGFASEVRCVCAHYLRTTLADEMHRRTAGATAWEVPRKTTTRAVSERDMESARI